jgi:hypothetical protein
VEEGAHARSFRTPVPFIPLLNPPLEPLPPSPFPLHRGFTPRSAHSRARVAITASGSPCNGLLIGSKVTVTKGYREYYRPAMTRAMTRLDRHVRPLRTAPPLRPLLPAGFPLYRSHLVPTCRLSRDLPRSRYTHCTREYTDILAIPYALLLVAPSFLLPPPRLLLAR